MVVGVCLTLLLLVLGVFANNHDFTFSLYNLAFFADFLNGRFNFHLCKPAFLLEYFLVKSYFERHVIRPFVRSYTETSTVTWSPGKILI